MYLLVAAAIITDSSPLKYFWVAVRGYLALTSGWILPPPNFLPPLGLSMYLATLTGFELYFYLSPLNFVSIMAMAVALIIHKPSWPTLILWPPCPSENSCTAAYNAAGGTPGGRHQCFPSAPDLGGGSPWAAGPHTVRSCG